ncbi:MAG TPA: DUF309 domain-containing protein [Bacillus sp. (in: firmicutes)]|uniref:DUF309 domain-containing protein n=1 Tax=Bacillus litorisediminis TaxID=2922713 RepID=UPI001FAEB344|nr:DUF309 domain-containing protein [Bacillus litorisediminis]HWO75811.1 DUF309 domain-containing protein [Bacillus sp. (in: firmicutes)]
MYPYSYILFLSYFHGNRDYFECHEVLEDYWKSPEGHSERIWVGLIQTAVGFYHYRRENLTGAKKMFEKSINTLKLEQDAIKKLGLDAERYFNLLDVQIKKIERNDPYESVNLPIVDHELLAECKKVCREHNWTFAEAAALPPAEIIHKHKMRDRTEVEESRKEAIKRKRKRSF